MSAHVRKPRVVIFLGGYLPARHFGGSVTSIANLVEALGDEVDFSIISHDHDLDDPARLPGIQDGWNQVGKARVLYLNEREFTTDRFSGLLQEIRPDVAYLSSVFYAQMNRPALFAARRVGVPVILAPRGELLPGALAMGRAKKQVYLAALRASGVLSDMTLQATSDAEAQAIRSVLRASDEQIVTLPDMPCFLREAARPDYEGPARFVFLSRIHPIKGLDFALEVLGGVTSEVSFDVYGPIEDEAYWEHCQQLMAALPKNVCATYRGEVGPGEAQDVFAHYDCLLFPTHSENYGNVVAEAVTAGCSVFISKGTTQWDDLDCRAGRALPLGDVEAWRVAIEELAQSGSDEAVRRAQSTLEYAKDKLAHAEIQARYLELFSQCGTARGATD